jgi:hypothetical protein
MGVKKRRSGTVRIPFFMSRPDLKGPIPFRQETGWSNL